MLSKLVKTDPKVLRALKRSVAQVKAMTPEQVETMMKAQRASWMRQEMD